jgi:hypothetical protein
MEVDNQKQKGHPGGWLFPFQEGIEPQAGKIQQPSRLE